MRVPRSQDCCRLGGEHIIATSRPPAHAELSTERTHRSLRLSTLLTRSGRREANRQTFDTANERDAHRLERHRVADDFDVGETGEELPERDRDLAARQVRAEAEV